jgi:glycosyltransferase involved in cell wall biosynthesis
MKHVIVCREYPPAPYPPGGIGTYVAHLARLLAESGETVHVVAQRWEGARAKVIELSGGRLVVHRVSCEEAEPDTARDPVDLGILRGLAESDCPSQAFSWRVAQALEWMVTTENIDLIEGPDWEAPLYYFQLRRALGLGPRSQPPCVVHLHSPSELIFRHNDWDPTLSDYRPLCRLEEYSVQAADALLCPSRYLSRQAEQLFAIAPAKIQVIPYPLGDTPRIERDQEIWQTDTICYVGRLELRKGILEWVEAAVKVAQSHPTVVFEFIGSDTSLDGGPGRSVRDCLKDVIPRSLRTRFRFHGSVTRAKLMHALAKTPVAVVPSRWENLPYSCIEAMAAGLPVLVSPTGGMAELVADDESGWVAPDSTADGLASALWRVLDTPADRRAEMGRNAETTVRRICSNEAVLQLHLDWRRRVVGAGPSRSLKVPAPAAVLPAASSQQGMAVVVNCSSNPNHLSACLRSIEQQTYAASLVVVVGGDGNTQHVAGHPDVEFFQATSLASARDLAVQRILRFTPPPRGVLFLRDNVRLHPEYLSVCNAVFQEQPRVGLILSFLQYEGRRGKVDVTMGGAPPQVFPSLDTLPCAAARADALQSIGDVGANWAIVTHPTILASIISSSPRVAGCSGDRKRYSAIALAQHGSAQLTLDWFLAASWAEKARWVTRIVTQPGRTAHWLAWRLRNARAR